MKYTTLLLDADDTMFDFQVCEYNALKNTIEGEGRIFTQELFETYDRINSALWRKLELGQVTRSRMRIQRFGDLIECCLDGQGDAEKYADRYIHELSLQAALLPGTLDAVKDLSKLFELYVITNGLTDVQKGRFARSPVTQYMKDIFISDELDAQKPDKIFFDRVLTEIREKDPDRVLVVGDSLTSDMQGGRNAGLSTCLFDPKGKISMPHPLCDFRIKSLTELSAFA